MSSAFVLMPFDEGFAPVYSEFIKPVLESAGVVVSRADNIESQQNILRDVMGGIGGSDLIIADLTGSNPNVYYELGVAHASRKPVIHLTQSLEEVPFDLRSYRLIEYSTHFSKIEEAREKLRNYAEAFLRGELLIGSPVTDFYPGSEGPILSNDRGSSREDGEDARANGSADQEELGFLDHIIQITDGYQQLAQITESVNNRTATLVGDLNVATQEINRISANKSDSSAKAAQAVARRLADKMDPFNTALNSFNKEFAEVLEKTEDNLEFVVSLQAEQLGATDPNLVEQLQPLRELLEQLRNAREAVTGMADSMDAMPRMERRLNREVTRGTQELFTMRGNLDRLLASISRALNKVEPDGSLL